MSISQVELANTFNVWRVRTNQIITVSNDLTDGNLLTTGTISLDNPDGFEDNVTLNVKSGLIYGDGGLLSNVGTPASISNDKLINSTITVNYGNQIELSSSTIELGDTVFLNVSNLSVSVNDTSTSNLTSANAVNAVHTIATEANARSLLSYDKSNTNAIYIFSAWDKANTANLNATIAINSLSGVTTGLSLGSVNTAAAFAKANAAYIHANDAYNFANTRFASAGGTISGDVLITGELVVTGNTTLLNTSSLNVSDPLIYLAANNYTSDVVDIGFVGNYVNTTGQNVHTGFFRDASSKEYYVFDSYDVEPGNEINPSANEFRIATLNSGIRTSNLILGGANTIQWINRAETTANAANTTANQNAILVVAAYDRANTANDNVTTALSAAADAAASVGSAFNKANAVSTNTVTAKIGTTGDYPGQIAITNTHIYFSSNTYDGSANVWRSIPVSGEFNDSAPYLLAPYFYGHPSSGITIFMHKVTADFSLPANAEGSYLQSRVNTTASTVLELNKNGSNVGIIYIESAANTGTFNVVSQVEFTRGDMFSIINNPAGDATIEDIAISILGRRK